MNHYESNAQIEELTDGDLADVSGGGITNTVIGFVAGYILAPVLVHNMEHPNQYGPKY